MSRITYLGIATIGQAVLVGICKQFEVPIMADTFALTAGLTAIWWIAEAMFKYLD